MGGDRRVAVHLERERADAQLAVQPVGQRPDLGEQLRLREHFAGLRHIDRARIKVTVPDLDVAGADGIQQRLRLLPQQALQRRGRLFARRGRDEQQQQSGHERQAGQ